MEEMTETEALKMALDGAYAMVLALLEDRELQTVIVNDFHKFAYRLEDFQQYVMKWCSC